MWKRKLHTRRARAHTAQKIWSWRSIRDNEQICVFARGIKVDERREADTLHSTLRIGIKSLLLLRVVLQNAHDEEFNQFF